ncbi:YcbK family protein [Marinobacterium arenosum]|uniref:YcbK family protein n=1 Tax=Marinobacterium arenosum TaxID=2862496 RepID=UPI001C956720|nr:DUF882 domain-containing protein [Marinobacterium arenosum]MBY4675280.1 DUF882 domain-containing protein [Marinobacterium arenosum]
MIQKPLRRRCFLKALSGATLGAIGAPGLAKANVRSNFVRDQDIGFLNLHTGEKLLTSFWTPDGYQPDALQSINHVLRDHRADLSTQMDIRLLEMLAELRRRLGTHELFHVISAYRSPQTNEMLRNKGHKVAKRSFHTKGQAIDIRIPGIELRDLHRAALSLKHGGVGLYTGSDFVHVDVGPVRRWGS